MQLHSYQCDQCKKRIGKKAHFSFFFGEFSGVANPPDLKDLEVRSLYGITPRWSVHGSLKNKFVHLCNVTCLFNYFMAMWKEYALDVEPTKAKPKKHKK